MEKEQVLASLYNLRAGLSVISVEKGSVVNSKNNQVKEEKEAASLQKATKRKVRDIEDRLEWKKRVANRNLFVGIIVDCVFPIFVNIIKILFALLGPFLLCWGLFYGGWFNDWMFSDPTPKWATWRLIFVIVGLVITLAAIFVVFAFVGFSEYFEGMLVQSPSEIATDKKEAKEQIKVLEKEKRTLLGEAEKKRAEYEVVNKETTAVLREKKKNCQAVYTALEKQYSPLLDSRDWQHIDLLIFYFETRRADNMKEALQLVDRQVQTNSILQAIKTATAEITDTIRISTSRMAQIVGNGFTLLSSQLGELQRTQNLQLMQMNEMINEQKMLKALQQKANVNSMQLMEDVKYMRTLAENAEVRRRNNA
ncbi:MAG: hypothetical protein IJ506_00595 [Clostridia bacterium]|nr:hypothetical protein [Clostridia bacterium]